MTENRMQSPRAAGRVPGPGNEMLAVGDTSTSATSAPGGKKLYQEEDIGKLAVLGREHPADSGVATKFAMCVAAASVAEFATYPLDLTKTRLQIQGEVRSQGGQAPVKYRGMIQTALGIAREEGFFHLWRGIPPALLRHAIYTGFRMSAYEEIRNKLTKNDKNGFPIWKKVVAGMLAGGIGQLMASPTDLIKTQIQMEGRRRMLGQPPRVKGTWDAASKVLHQAGLTGLWRGCWPNVWRAALVNLGDLSTYDSVKRGILDNSSLEDNTLTHTLSSACAGLVGAIMGTPADVVKARVMNQPTDSRGRGSRYTSALDCLVTTVRGEGFFALYKGFLPCWLRMAPWSLTFWLSYEQIRRAAGTKSW